jgi:carboxypeptidase C (cathepsin A)
MAQEEKDKDKPENGDDKFPTPEDQISVTQHTATINGQEINYTVTAGTIVLKEEEEKEGKSEGEKAKATMFFIAYTRDGVDDYGQRP